MTKYVIAVLVFLAALAALLLYVGNEPRLVLESTANSGVLQFETRSIPWQWVIGFITFAIIALIGLWSILGLSLIHI